MAGWGWQAVHDPAVLPDVMAKWASSIETGAPFEMVFPLRGGDGVFRRFLTRVIPLRNADGRIVRWLGTNTDFESQMAAEEALAVSEQKFGVLTDAMPHMVWSNLPDGEIDYFNERWHEFAGDALSSRPPAEIWESMIHPDDREQVTRIWRESLESGQPYTDEYRMRHASGEYRWILGSALPARNAEGRIVRWIGTCTDMHKAKQDAQANELLSRELSHRIKNIFAVIGGLIGLSAFRDPTAKVFAKELSGRVTALGRAHNFARPHSDMSRPDSGVNSLQGLLGELLAPYCREQGDCFTITGRDPAIDDRAATPLALVIHELATNAAKYGALAAPEGSIAITISREDECIRIEWQESGGPVVDGPPAQVGFGTELSSVSIVDQLGGTLERDWRPEGLRVTIEIRADRLSGDADQ